MKKSPILIVDDDFINRAVLSNIFSPAYSIIEAENGVDGLEKFDARRGRFAAVLLDVNMPIMNGIEMLKELCKRGAPQRVPVFMVTASEDNDIAKEAYDMGVMDIISKPITPFIITKRVESIIELFNAREVLSRTVESQEEKLIERENTIDALNRSTIEALAAAIEFRDVESGEHTNRIYGITKHILLNTEMGDGFTEEEIESMAIGSIMHDIGKIAIPDHILNKPARLTSEEYEIMKGHTVKGAALMEQLSHMQVHDSYMYACDISRHHHERWDGKGYPDGLVGDEISIWSQVVSIADVYDALVSPRVYKAAFDHDAAVEMIKRGECGAFNPKLLDAFLSVEPEIRKWYTDGASISDSISAAAKDRPKVTFAEKIQLSQNFTETLLLMAAVRSTFDLLIFANLTKNSFYTVDYDRAFNRAAKQEGVFDELIENALTSIPEGDYDAFKSSFGRESLLSSYEKGHKTVNLIHKQRSDDGAVHTVETRVMLMEDSRTGDIMDVTLSRLIDGE